MAISVRVSDKCGAAAAAAAAAGWLELASQLWAWASAAPKHGESVKAAVSQRHTAAALASHEAIAHAGTSYSICTATTATQHKLSVGILHARLLNMLWHARTGCGTYRSSVVVTSRSRSLGPRNSPKLIFLPRLDILGVCRHVKLYRYTLSNSTWCARAARGNAWDF